MKLDRKALDRLLSLDDEQLKNLISSLAASTGLDLGSLGISDGNIASVRKALSGATDEDIKKASQQLEAFGKRRKQ